MTTQYWLVKQEPEAYSWTTFVKDRKTIWDGVRNYQARNNLNAMRKGDLVLFYASVGPKEVQGIVTVAKESFPDPSTEDERWTAVELKVTETLPSPVTLEQIKAEPSLSEISLIRQSRLSVMPLRKAEFDKIVRLGGSKPPSRKK